MKKQLIALLALFLLFSASVVAQEEVPTDKQMRKAMQAAHEEDLFNVASQAIHDRDFVLEADRVEFKYGVYEYVTPSTNFVLLKGDKATIQLAFDGVLEGYNGLGGITVDGTASNIQIKTDKKGNVSFSMMVQGALVSASVSFRLVKGSTQCTVTVSPNFSSDRVAFTGTIYPSEESNVFKGSSF